MAKNYKFSGKRVTITGIAANVTSGALARAKGFIGMPLNNALAGASVTFALEGAWGMTFSGQGTVSIGTILYWDVGEAGLSIGAANDDYAAVKAITAPSGTAFIGLLLPQGSPYGQEQ